MAADETGAEAAVREAASISASEAVAMEPPVVDLLAEDGDALLAAIDGGERADGREFAFRGEPLPALGDLPMRDVTMNLGQQFLHALSDPNIAFILFTIGFYGIVAELFHPNFFSGIAGGIALVLAFIVFKFVTGAIKFVVILAILGVAAFILLRGGIGA